MTNPLQDFRPESLCLLKESQEDYWQYARKGPCDFSVYTEKSSIYEAPAKERFREASDVLVRWTDGLLYLANIIQVEEEYSRCAVKFEDGSQFWALFKDIYKGPLPNGEISCTVCDSGCSQPPDEIVICDKCSVGYHQLCHIPAISSSVLKPEISWSCRKCIFASTTKKGGSLKRGPNAQAMMVMKQALPYDPKSLTWDGSHRSNLQQTYCYCGGPGEWYMKMMQCSRCKQWFHEACLQCLEEPLLYGDRFYIFVCSVCNNGPEFLRRLPVRWPDIAHLVLFNLTVMHGKKYFDVETTIMIFLKDKWSQFQIKGEELARLSNEGRKQKMLEILQKSKSRFTSGKEIKKKTTLWGLRSRVPPPTPVITLPETGVITDEVLDALSSNGKKSKVFIKSISAPMLPMRRKRNPSLPDAESSDTKSIPKSEKIVQPSQDEARAKKVIEPPKKKEKRKLRQLHNRCPKLNGARKFTLSLPSMSDFSDSCDTSSSQGTLNAIIPHPTDFEGRNNPFLSGYPTTNPRETNRTAHKNSLAIDKSSSVTNRNSSANDKNARVSNAELDVVASRTRKFSESLLSSRQSMKLRTRLPRKTALGGPRCVVDSLLNDSCAKVKDELAKNDAVVTVKSHSELDSYFGVEDRIANGEKFSILAKRIAPDGKVQYLIEWDSVPS